MALSFDQVRDAAQGRWKDLIFLRLQWLYLQRKINMDLVRFVAVKIAFVVMINKERGHGSVINVVRETVLS